MGKDSIVFCIAGMHRSGTSLLANWFRDSGIDIGINLLGGNFSNKKGHFEDVHILKIIKKDLVDKNLNISGLVVNSPLTLTQDNLDRFISYYQKKMGEQELWGWKEPRSTLYINNIKQYIPELKIIGIYREPETVVNSLLNRMYSKKWFYYLYPHKTKVQKIVAFIKAYASRSKWTYEFLNAYIKYNESLLNFHNEYPHDCLVISYKDLIRHHKQVSLACKDFLGKDIRFAEFSKVYDQSLTTKKAMKESIERIDKYKAAESIYNRLEAIKCPQGSYHNYHV